MQNRIDEPFDLSALSPELVLHVFSFCTPKELLLLARVSKLVKHFASDNQIWSRLFANIGGNVNNKQNFFSYKECYKTALQNARSLKSFQQLASELESIAALTNGFISLFKNLVGLQSQHNLNSNALHGALIFRLKKMSDFSFFRMAQDKLMEEHLEKSGITEEGLPTCLLAFKQYVNSLPDSFFVDFYTNKKTLLSDIRKLIFKLFPQINEDEMFIKSISTKPLTP